MREEGAVKRDQGSGMVKLWLALAAVAAIIAICAVVFWNGEAESFPLQQEGDSTPRIAEAVSPKGSSNLPARSGKDSASPLPDETEDKEEESAVSDSGEEPRTEEEKREAEEEQLVNSFDDLTDRWQEPSAKGVTMSDIDNFAAAFRKIPKARQDECIHRALNLIPDENVMLLAGVLMDKSMDKEIVETVYNDVLNRDEDVKKPILQQIFKDKSHPCWADTAWILDVTDELPKAK